MRTRRSVVTLLALLILAACPAGAFAEGLKVHRIFSSNMVLQRDKPINVWGWAKTGEKVSVQFGKATGRRHRRRRRGPMGSDLPRAACRRQRRDADRLGRAMRRSRWTNIVIGDVWVMNGQSNMAFGLGNTLAPTWNPPRPICPCCARSISRRMSTTSSRRTSRPTRSPSGPSARRRPRAAFPRSATRSRSRVQRALGIPIGVIDNSRGGASIESLVPKHMFKTDPLAAKYLDYVEKRPGRVRLGRGRAEARRQMGERRRRAAQEGRARRQASAPSRPARTCGRGTFPARARPTRRAATTACSASSRA